MNTVFITSPDKISIKRFIQFIGKYLNGYEIGNMHSLMTIESINLYMGDFFEKFPKRIISYYARKVTTNNPISIMPEKILNSADLIIWFSLYSLKPEVIKSREEPHILKGAIMDWEKHINKMQERSL